MESEESTNEQQDALQNIPMEVSRERVESLWRQVLNQKSSARSDLAEVRSSRAKAEMERQRISNDALNSTREACRQLISETERQLARARLAEAEAAKKLAEGEKEFTQAQVERAEADSYRERVMAEADQYREKVMSEAQQETQRMREEARSSALQECQDLKRHVTYEVQAILAEVDSIRAAAQEELEAQRIYAETANIKATIQDVRAQVLGNVDRAVSEGFEGNGDVSFPGATESHESTGLDEAQGLGPMMEPQEVLAEIEPQHDTPQDQQEETALPKTSKAQSSK